MKIRLFKPEDTEQIARLFHKTVRQINIQDYSSKQVTAWSPENIYFRNWREICSNRFTYVAEENSQIIGFGELESNGHLDCFYVHYQHQRRGVGRQIYQAIETKARELDLSCLFTQASITAQPFFISQGFRVIASQQVFCRGEAMMNYQMDKVLTID